MLNADEMVKGAHYGEPELNRGELIRGSDSWWLLLIIIKCQNTRISINQLTD